MRLNNLPLRYGWRKLMRVSVLGGTGGLGFAVALRLAKAGVEVVIGSRQAEKAVKAATQILTILGDARVYGRVNHEAVEGCDVVFFTIPYEAVDEIARSVAPSLQQGCLAVSCIVSMSENGVSSAEFLASRLPSWARVVAALHTVSASALIDVDKPLNMDTFIFGDNSEDKKTVARLLSVVEGLRPVDGGPLKNSRYGEAFTRFLMGVNKRYGVGNAGIRVTGLADEAVWKRWGR
ncbi:MAG: NADPH-dependent F420 reductase [Candidatus Caldarchaeum sp.]